RDLSRAEREQARAGTRDLPVSPALHHDRAAEPCLGDGHLLHPDAARLRLSRGGRRRRGIGRTNHGQTTLLRKSSSQPARLRFPRMDSLPGARLRKLKAACLIVAKFAGAWSLRTRLSSSRKTMSITQCRLFSTLQ